MRPNSRRIRSSDAGSLAENRGGRHPLERSSGISLESILPFEAFEASTRQSGLLDQTSPLKQSTEAIQRNDPPNDPPEFTQKSIVSCKTLTMHNRPT